MIDAIVRLSVERRYLMLSLILVLSLDAPSF